MFIVQLYGYDVDGNRLYVVIDIIDNTVKEDTFTQDYDEAQGMADYLNEDDK